ncbi:MULTISPECIES: peptide chain release factor 1 [unclassified Bartonella]|uniref:peptide chain release factor 1 n=1 Tax=unclassified Bartonella TaxID=2645622 RepID=UPI000999FFBC|nr:MULTISPECIES: peptide chain release factor 1 [unclassified Bartonella]AQX28324.1 bacterial peptide chain release factor 1 (bRF-1) [Bartonella sp. JB15]AQX29593.1 bacterial peptide chain release factor 1 (bRF-1) [Bartonella sp. JB63]
MVSLPQDRMKQLEKRFEIIESQMAENPNAETYVKLASEYAELQPIIVPIRELNSLHKEIAELETIISDTKTDTEIRNLAQEELLSLYQKIQQIEKKLQILLLPKDIADEKSVIIEIRAGTGGSEAALFAGNLFRMYERYANTHNWKVEVISLSDGEVGGYKEIIATISGKGVFSKLKFESGVHRVQRIPETETGGRIHTSAATVAVLPEAEEIDIEIRPEDIRIDTMRASGAGGQHVNTTDSAVRITHIPTGIMVVQAEKSQHQNRARALQILRARLFDIKRQKAESERSASRKTQVGSGDRSERIRTYNFPQGRVTDHRINLTLYKLDRIMEGDLNELINALISDHQTTLLTEMDHNK